MDKVSEDRLGEVNLKLADLVRLMAAKLATEGVDIRVTQGLRTWDEQEGLYAQGRTAPGKVVTNAPAGHSYHNFGLAVDLVPMTDQGPDWNSAHPVWQQMIKAGVSLGLTSGSIWRTFPDMPHFQLTGTLPASPNDVVRATYQTGGVPAVWKLAGLVSQPVPDLDGELSV